MDSYANEHALIRYLQENKFVYSYLKCKGLSTIEKKTQKHTHDNSKTRFKEQYRHFLHDFLIKVIVCNRKFQPQ